VQSIPRKPSATARTLQQIGYLVPRRHARRLKSAWGLAGETPFDGLSDTWRVPECSFHISPVPFELECPFLPMMMVVHEDAKRGCDIDDHLSDLEVGLRGRLIAARDFPWADAPTLKLRPAHAMVFRHNCNECGHLMTSGNPKLRAELQRLTVPPKGAGIEWLDVQIEKMEELKGRLPHGVRIHSRFSEAIYDLNCFMFALGMAPEVVSDMRLAQIFPGQTFVRSLLADGHLRETKADGPIAIYFRDGIPEHAGKREDGNVISKWGAGGTHIWRHPLWDVPSEYGNEVRLFANLPTAVELYRAWAADRGL
jgi:hypothetical protein